MASVPCVLVVGKSGVSVAVRESRFANSLRPFLGGLGGSKFGRSGPGLPSGQRKNDKPSAGRSKALQRLMDGGDIDKVIEDAVREDAYQYPTTLAGYMAGDSTLGAGGGSDGGLGKKSSGVYFGPHTDKSIWCSKCNKSYSGDQCFRCGGY